MIDPRHAVLLGIVEGLTEYLPVSSTGHLILAAHWWGLEGEVVKTFEVIIQAGAVAAVFGLYRSRVRAMLRAVSGHDVVGQQLLRNLLISFLPAAVVGLLLHRVIKARLFGVWPVVAALALGGLFMIGVEWWRARWPHTSARNLESMSVLDAFLIGCAQCVSLWPGTSRAMVTIVAGLLLGFPATVAAEYSFLLALPTLGAATLFDAATGGRAVLTQIGGVSLLCGFVTAAVVAVLAIRGFVRYLTHRGLALFGWYRLALAALVWFTVR